MAQPSHVSNMRREGQLIILDNTKTYILRWYDLVYWYVKAALSWEEKLEVISWYRLWDIWHELEWRKWQNELRTIYIEWLGKPRCGYGLTKRLGVGKEEKWTKFRVDVEYSDDTW